MLKLTLDAIEIIDAIDRGGSFAAAAEALHKVPSTISYTVAKLEEQLGFPLFSRRGPRVTLTPAGRELLSEGRWLLRSAADLESRLRRIATGYESELRLVHDSLLPTVALLDHIRAFEALDCGTRLRISSEVMTGSWEALREGRADLILAVGDPPPGFAQQAKRLHDIEFVFCVAPQHPLARIDRPLRTDDFLAHTAIVVADSARLLPTRSIGLLSGQSRITVSNIEAKIALQIAGLGYGFLPRCRIDAALTKRELVARDVAETRASEPLWLAWNLDGEGEAQKWWRARLLAPGALMPP
ncbi:MAG: LysR family transcriptional regulator [Rhodocyclales bacterium RIFCSPLOWO2_02_FULL_63_24]|nr:MAG: LysR family transcriptional regulator [Rhodocyclales bacterium RIFCSPLOWO2_02_FULL_63_24]